MDYKLTQKSQEALSGAVRRAAADGHPEVFPAHLLGTLLAQSGGTAVPLLEAVGADVKKVRAETERLLAPYDLMGRALVPKPPPGVRRVRGRRWPRWPACSAGCSPTSGPDRP